MLRSSTRIRWPLTAFLVMTAIVAAVRPLHTQTPEARLDGHVILRDTATPVPGATVQVEGTTLTTQSDSAGRWTLPRVPAGAIGARRPPRGLTRALDIVMATSALQLEQVTVTADRAGRACAELGRVAGRTR